MNKSTYNSASAFEEVVDTMMCHGLDPFKT